LAVDRTEHPQRLRVQVADVDGSQATASVVGGK
jgi:hypothetical protein